MQHRRTGMWNELTGNLTFEEQQLVDYICDAGLKETRELQSKKPSAQTAGAILAFEILQDIRMSTFNELKEQYHLLEDRMNSMRGNVADYWKIRGQQLQIEFILDRLLAYRVLTDELDAPIPDRAGEYVSKYLNLLEAQIT
jgi:hypothetical protein